MQRRQFIASASATVLVLASSTKAFAANTTLVVYSNSLSEGRGEWLQEKAKTIGLDLKFVSLGGGDIQNRLLVEKNNPLADVVFGLNNIYFSKLKSTGVLDLYKPVWSAEVDGSLGDMETYWPIVKEPIMLVYGDLSYPGGKGAPNDWSDLWLSNRFAKKYEVPNSAGAGTTQMVISGILSRYLQDGGELGVSTQGWAYIKQYFENGSPSIQGEDLYARIKKGDVNIGQMWLAGKSAREKQYGIKTTPIASKIGVPYVVQQISVVKGSKNLDSARKFIDWFGSADIQAEWSKRFFTMPTNSKAVAKADPEVVKQSLALPQQKIDWKRVIENLPKWVEKIELMYLNS